jgi:hypothetical protein
LPHPCLVLLACRGTVSIRRITQAHHEQLTGMSAVAGWHTGVLLQGLGNSKSFHVPALGAFTCPFAGVLATTLRF